MRAPSAAPVGRAADRRTPEAERRCRRSVGGRCKGGAAVQRRGPADGPMALSGASELHWLQDPAGALWHQPEGVGLGRSTQRRRLHHTHLLAHVRLGPLLPHALLQRYELIPPRLPHLWGHLQRRRGRAPVRLHAPRSSHAVSGAPRARHGMQIGGARENTGRRALPGARWPRWPVLLAHVPAAPTAGRKPTCSGSSAAGVPSSSLYWKQPMRSKRKVEQKSTSSRCSASLSPAGQAGREDARVKDTNGLQRDSSTLKGWPAGCALPHSRVYARADVLSAWGRSMLAPCHVGTAGPRRPAPPANRPGFK